MSDSVSIILSAFCSFYISLKFTIEGKVYLWSSFTSIHFILIVNSSWRFDKVKKTFAFEKRGFEMIAKK